MAQPLPGVHGAIIEHGFGGVKGGALMLRALAKL